MSYKLEAHKSTEKKLNNENGRVEERRIQPTKLSSKIYCGSVKRAEGPTTQKPEVLYLAELQAFASRLAGSSAENAALDLINLMKNKETLEQGGSGEIITEVDDRKYDTHW
ncbi:unnamed protein product [Enterobius vermicularis]|uniref:Ovule protein n=1 Tax=Enterobius vermicularis TaxID=51028 RepID=A0A0N4VN22_ENTVE|nr:unnamed protein product [Enterobius vermicularis]